jgi:5-oxoprolinase (ATP-hydrolysing) subunit A
MAKTFDINCDMGESFGNWRMGDDAALMPRISTANLACGFHAGDPVTMMTAVSMAQAAGVAVGAHPGLPDLLGFGRRSMAVTPDDVRALFTYQIGALDGFLRAKGMKLNHVKPHGALFHVLRDPALADAALDAIATTAPGAAIYWLAPEPFFRQAAQRGIRVCAEAYPDLDYNNEGSLIVERHKRNVPPDLVYSRVVEIITEKRLTNREGIKLPMAAESICIHGDGPNAVEVAEAARRAIADCGRTVACATQMPSCAG